jgi:hypothetical protein
MSTNVTPLRVMVPAAPQPAQIVAERRAAANREQILEGLSDKEKMLVASTVAALEALGTVPGHLLGKGPAGMAVSVLLRAFVDATGVAYVGCEWDTVTSYG